MQLLLDAAAARLRPLNIPANLQLVSPPELLLSVSDFALTSVGDKGMAQTFTVQGYHQPSQRHSTDSQAQEKKQKKKTALEDNRRIYNSLDALQGATPWNPRCCLSLCFPKMSLGSSRS